MVRPGGWSDCVEEQEEEEVGSPPQDEDLHSLLVKAWEAKVFPVIQRRFRNDQERRSGLEQIRGALQLGMSPPRAATAITSSSSSSLSLSRDGEHCSGDSGVLV